MSEAKHTPGPWTAQQDGTRVYAGKIKINTPECFAGHSLLVCVAQCDHIDDTSQDRVRRVADARLIAASPDLLAACKYALARFTHGPEAITNPNDAIVDDLRAAIAKAEGGAA